MQKFVLRKGDHTVSTVSPTEKVTYVARGYTLVQPEAVKVPETPAPKAKTKAPEADAK